MDSVGDLQGFHVLELASGTGHLAKQPVARGATVVGIDVAASMVELARRHVPDATFQKGDAEVFSFEDASIDVVLCCFGLLHFAHPEKAFREAARVLKPGGTCAFTVWQEPDKRSESLGLIPGIYQAHAKMEVGLPPAPPMFALADPAVHDPMLTQAGFEDIHTQIVDVVWPLRGPETTVEFALKGAVRTRMLFERQTSAVRQRIREALITGTMPYSHNRQAGIPCPAMLVKATKKS